ncbi:MAG: hypothetical protein WAT39_01895 [Planctomycetota bacterium]
MGNVHFCVSEVEGITIWGQSMQVARSTNHGASQVIASSGTSQQTTLTAAKPATFPEPDCRKRVWEVTNLGTTAVYVLFGANPTALANGTVGKVVPAGATRFFSVSAWDEKAAVIDAA